MPATLQSQMPQKVVVSCQDGTEAGEHVALRVTLALANEAPPLDEPCAPLEVVCGVL